MIVSFLAFDPNTLQAPAVKTRGSGRIIHLTQWLARSIYVPPSVVILKAKMSDEVLAT